MNIEEQPQKLVVKYIGLWMRRRTATLIASASTNKQYMTLCGDAVGWNKM